MDTKLKIVLLLTVVTVNAGLIPVAPRILEGPSSRTILVGPDGSQISAIIPGGRILLEGEHGPLLQGAPEVVAIPSVAQSIPVVAAVPVGAKIIADVPVQVAETPAATTDAKNDAESISVDALATKSVPEQAEDVTETKANTTAPTTETDTTAPETEAPQNEAQAQTVNEEALQIVESTVTNSTSNESSNEVSTTTPSSNLQEAPAVVKSVKNPVILSYIHDSPLFVPDDTGFEGHYIDDNLEKLFDDGSYKPGDFQW